MADKVSKDRQARGYEIHRKLTAKKVREIRALHKQGTTYREISNRYKIVHSMIWFIVSRRYWKHVK